MHSAVKLKDWMRAAVAVVLVSVLAACGGGGGSSSSNNNNSSTILNGGSLPASPTQQPIAANGVNAVQISVGQGLSGVVNLPMVSVTICPPGSTSNCQTINNIQVDTGSFGLRVVASVLNTSLLGSLPGINTSSGAQVAECATFADGYTWGTVRTANVGIGGETAANVPIQIIGDKDPSTVPARGCTGTSENSTSALGANGILGIGTSITDCGATCSDPTTAANFSNYFACPGGASCTRTAVPLAQQVTNPVSKFATDNNGVIVTMPPITSVSGAAPSATGTLVFGINTQSNNALTGVQAYTTDAFGDLNNSVYNGATVQAFLDSGSNAYFFGDNSITLCDPSKYPGFYCPPSALTRSVTLIGLNNATTTASIGILSASTLFGNNGNYAFNDLAGQIGGNTSFDLGLPFFYGRHVYYAIDQTQGGLFPGGQAPYVAF